MSRHSTLFPVNSLYVPDTFSIHHQEINKINCICNLWYGNSIVRPVAYAVNFIDLLMMDTECVRNI
jgi:hypothetical protein